MNRGGRLSRQLLGAGEVMHHLVSRLRHRLEVVHPLRGLFLLGGADFGLTMVGFYGTFVTMRVRTGPRKGGKKALQAVLIKVRLSRGEAGVVLCSEPRLERTSNRALGRAGSKPESAHARRCCIGPQRHAEPIVLEVSAQMVNKRLRGLSSLMACVL